MSSSSSSSSSSPTRTPHRIAIVVHGGAGALSDTSIPNAKKGCTNAVQAGYQVLLRQGTALEAVEQAIRILESNPNFNAGTGSVLTRNGRVEMDALIIDGRTLRAGAVTGIDCVAHPISLAKYVMRYTPHLLLGNNQVLRQFIHQLSQTHPSILEELQVLENPSILITEARRKQLQITIEQLQKSLLLDSSTGSNNDAWGMMTANIPLPSTNVINSTGLGETATIIASSLTPDPNNNKSTEELTKAIQFATQRQQQQHQQQQQDHPCNGDHDTVGAVAIDMYGNIAAATSTGGMTMKFEGRIGDTPIIGAGGYAHNNLGGISTTGTGEYIMRAMLAKEVANIYHEYGGIANEEKFYQTFPSTQPGFSSLSTSSISSSTVTTSVSYAQQIQPISYATRIVHEALSRMRTNVGGPGAGLIYITPLGDIGIGHYSARMSWAYAVGKIEDTLTEEDQILPIKPYSIVSGVQQSVLSPSDRLPVSSLPSSWCLPMMMNVDNDRDDTSLPSSNNNHCLPVKCCTETISFTRSIDVCESHVNETRFD